MLEKHSEAVMCHHASYGGLGVAIVKFKAQPVIIRTFLETTAKPKFRHRLRHSILFRYHVLGDSGESDQKTSLVGRN